MTSIEASKHSTDTGKDEEYPFFLVSRGGKHFIIIKKKKRETSRATFVTLIDLHIGPFSLF